MKGVDADLLATHSDVLGGQHGSVGGGLIRVGLDLHAASDSGDGFTAGEISDVDESIIERREDTGDAEDKLALAVLQTNSVRHDVDRSGWGERSEKAA